MIQRLREFVITATETVSRTDDEDEILTTLKQPLSDLVSHDDWLPEPFAQPDRDYYQQYLLHCDPLERFSVVSFVWGPGQMTPVHNHKVWGLIGMLRGAEIATRFASPAAGKPMREEGEERLEPGMVDVVSPRLGDIHRVRNAYSDRVSISIHIYGGNIGRIARDVFDPHNGERKRFISSYSAEQLPNIWS